MAVAVKNTPETTSGPALDRTVVHSLFGAVYVLASLAVVFYGIPRLWAAAVTPWLAAGLGSFIDAALLLVAVLAAACGLVILGQRLAGPTLPAGAKAGTFFAFVTLVVIGLLTQAIGVGLLHNQLGIQSPVFGGLLTVAAGLVLLAVAVRAAFHPAVKSRLVLIEEQGWFSTESYKKNQGSRVRRGTVLGLLVLAGSGIYTLISHRTLASGSRHWQVAVPFTDGLNVVLLPDVQFTVPILLTLASLWLAFRVVNYPTFADFLIATEAEVNKVSWTTRRRLIQDTIVVLTTVFLLTAFLFVVDVAWGWGLSKIGVLQMPTGQTQESRQVDW